MAHRASNSRTTPNFNQREILDILEGNLLLEHCPTFRNVRIFLSSGYADCKFERRVLHKTAFPALRAYCESLGFQFHVVDLFRGLGVDEEESKSDAATLTRFEREGLFQLATKEIRLCQQTSVGPNFVTLLGQSYGYRPLCAHIEEDDFRSMCSALEGPAKELLCQWYRRNDNTKPPQYDLIQNQEVGEKDVEALCSTYEALSKAIRRAAKAALSKDPARVQKYLMSALEKEVCAGIFNIKTNPNEGCYWVKRTFTDLYEQRGNDPALLTYSDLIVGKRGLEFDVETIKTLNHLREARMCAKYVGLESENIFEFSLKWQKGKGLDPSHNPSHSAYLEDLCQKFTSGLKRRIEDRAAFMSAMDGHRTYQEVLHHGAYCRSHASTCLDRSSLSARIQSYLDSSLDKPLVVHGPAGSGKTTVMAAAAYRLKERSLLTKRTIVVRFLGTTPSSSSIRQTLKSICEQLSIVYKEDPLDIPADYRGIVEHFSRLLHKASPSCPTCIFLDAVDRLSPEDGALGMSWLPSSLPPHVRFVLSTSSEAQYGCFPVLWGLLCGHKDCFLEVPRLSQAECEEFLSHYLSSLHTQLTTQQQQVALQSFLLCPLPLYLLLLAKDISSWTLDTTVSTQTFPPARSIEGMIEHLFEQIECAHPVAMVSHSLGYITAAQYGLSEAELVDILACDEQVMSELKAPPFPLQWAKVYHRLAPFLEMGVGVGGGAVLRWGYRKVQEVAHSRYLGDKETRAARFRLLADYFGGKAKCRGDQDDWCLHINHQPLLLGAGGNPREQPGDQPREQPGDQPMEQPGEKHYNVRKLVELPYSLASSNRMGELASMLMNFTWIQACVLATSYADIIKDFAHVIPVVPLGKDGRGVMYRDIKLLREALALSSDGLNADPAHLCTQLIGRLLPYATPSGENRPLLKSILQNAIEDTHPGLVPMNPFFRIPGGPLLASMEGHRGMVSWVTSSTSDLATGAPPSMALFSSSWDNSLKSWDLRTVGVAKTFDGHTDRVCCVASSADGRHVVSGSRDMSVRYWEACSGHCLSTMRGHTAKVNAVVMTTDGNIAASGSADSTIMVWNVDRNSSTFGQLVFTMKPLKSSLLSMVLSQDDRHLAAGAQGGMVVIVDIVSGDVLVTLKEPHPITALGLAQMDRSSALIAGLGDGGIKVWDFPSGELIHCLAVQGGAVTSLSAGPNGRLLTVCNKTTSVWDIRTGGHLYNLTHPAGITCVHVADGGRLAVTGSEDQLVCIWDLETPPILETTKVLAGTVRAVSISPCGVYCAVGGEGEGGVVVVCELDTLKPVQRLEGHAGPVNHIVVLRDTRTVVTAADDGIVRLWNGEEGKCLQVFGSCGAAVNSVAVSHDGSLLMSGDREGKVTVWSTRSGKNLRTFANHKRSVVAVSFARGSTHHCMVSASADGVLCVRDFTSGKVMVESRLHREELVCLALSPNAAFLVTGSNDRCTQVVPLPGGVPSTMLSGHKGAVTCVDVFSDCETCLTGSADRTLRVWSTSSGRCLGSMFVDDTPLACAVSRNFTILYGAHQGWVSTAAYLPGSGTPNPLLKKLQGVEPALMGDEVPSDLEGSALEGDMEATSPVPPLVVATTAPAGRSVNGKDPEERDQSLRSDGSEKNKEPLKNGEHKMTEEPRKHGGLEECGDTSRDMEGHTSHAVGDMEGHTSHAVGDMEGHTSHAVGDMEGHTSHAVGDMEGHTSHAVGDMEGHTSHAVGDMEGQQYEEQSYSDITSGVPPPLGSPIVSKPHSSGITTQPFEEEDRTPKTASSICVLF